MEQENTQEQGNGLSGLAGGVAQFMAYSFMYNQLDNVWSGGLNSALKGNQMSIRVPWLKAMGGGKDIKGFAGFTTNIHGSMNKNPVSKSQVMQLLSRGDKASIDILRNAGVDEKILTSFGKNQTPGILGKIKHYASKTDRNILEKVADVNSRTVTKLGIAEQLGKTEVVDGLVSKMALKAGVASEELHGAVNLAVNSVKKHMLQPDAKNGMGLIINASIKSRFLGSVLRAPIGLAAMWSSPTYQMIVKPIEGAIKSAVKKQLVHNRVDDYKTGYVHSEIAMASQENQASLQMGSQNMYANRSMAAGILAAGRQSNKYLDQLMKAQQQPPLQPQQQRKRFR